MGVLVIQDAVNEYCRLRSMDNNVFPAVVEAERFSNTMSADQVPVSILFCDRQVGIGILLVRFPLL